MAAGDIAEVMMTVNEASIEKGDPHLSTLTKGIIVVLSSIHGLMLLIATFPIGVSPHSTLLPVMKPYQELTGTKQNWNMFKTIPSEHSLSAKMKVEFPDGHFEERGVFLPELEPIRFPDDKRYYYVILRIMFDKGCGKYRNAWQAGIAERLESEGARSYEVEVEVQATRHLFHIAKDGRLSKTMIDRFGTYGVFREH